MRRAPARHVGGPSTERHTQGQQTALQFSAPACRRPTSRWSMRATWSVAQGSTRLLMDGTPQTLTTAVAVANSTAAPSSACAALPCSQRRCASTNAAAHDARPASGCLICYSREDVHLIYAASAAAGAHPAQPRPLPPTPALAAYAAWPELPAGRPRVATHRRLPSAAEPACAAVPVGRTGPAAGASTDLRISRCKWVQVRKTEASAQRALLQVHQGEGNVLPFACRRSPGATARCRCTFSRRVRLAAAGPAGHSPPL